MEALIGLVVLAIFMFSFAVWGKEIWGKIRRRESLELGHYLILGFICFMLVALLQALGVIVVLLGAVAWYFAPVEKKGTYPHIEVSLTYFFRFAEYCLDNTNINDTIVISTGDRDRFREEYKKNNSMPDIGLLNFSKIEYLATNYVESHLKNRNTFVLGAAIMDGTPNLSMPIVQEVKNELNKILS
jgi:hypothetical protein